MLPLFFNHKHLYHSPRKTLRIEFASKKLPGVIFPYTSQSPMQQQGNHSKHQLIFSPQPGITSFHPETQKQKKQVVVKYCVSQLTPSIFFKVSVLSSLVTAKLHLQKELHSWLMSTLHLHRMNTTVDKVSSQFIRQPTLFPNSQHNNNVNMTVQYLMPCFRKVSQISTTATVASNYRQYVSYKSYQG